MNNDKQVFDVTVQKWISIDNQIKTVWENLKELREKRAHISEQMVSYMKDNKNATHTTSDGKIKFTHTKVYSPLTFQYIEQSLREIIHNDDQVKKIIHHLKNNRNEKIVSEIKRIS